MINVCLGSKTTLVKTSINTLCRPDQNSGAGQTPCIGLSLSVFIKCASASIITFDMSGGQVRGQLVGC